MEKEKNDIGAKWAENVAAVAAKNMKDIVEELEDNQAAYASFLLESWRFCAEASKRKDKLIIGLIAVVVIQFLIMAGVSIWFIVALEGDVCYGSYFRYIWS